MKPGMREDSSSRSALMGSTPFAVRARAEGLDGVRVMPRTCQSGRWRKVLATDPPWAQSVDFLTELEDYIACLDTGDVQYDNDLHHDLFLICSI
jgi:hypothetical protein